MESYTPPSTSRIPTCENYLSSWVRCEGTHLGPPAAAVAVAVVQWFRARGLDMPDVEIPVYFREKSPIDSRQIKLSILVRHDAAATYAMENFPFDYHRLRHTRDTGTWDTRPLVAAFL